MFFSIITKNSNWKISIKNFVTFKIGQGEFAKNQYREGLPKKGACTVRFNGGGVARKRGWCF